MPINLADQAIIAALRPHVEATLGKSQRFMRESGWTAKSNQYSKNVIQQIEDDDRNNAVRNPRHLAQYISSSSILHCMDGWSYLGRSLYSSLRGDPHRAIHLAYYAELRAAMALLACEGIGVFKKSHFAVVSPNRARKLHTRAPTHVFAWDCLEHWGNLPSSGQLLGRLIRPEGRNLLDWFNPIGGAGALAPQAQAWFLQWGMDLGKLAKDRDARNESSYRPDGLPRMWNLCSAKALQFVRSVWQSLEPSALALFGEIDRHIFRIALENAFRGQSGKKRLESEAYGAFVDRVLNPQNLADGVAAGWKDFLLRHAVPDDLELIQLSRNAPISAPDDYAGMAARATLLLRVASGSVAELLNEAGVSSKLIEFWWGAVGNARGLWETPLQSENLLDLWADIHGSIEKVGEFQVNGKNSFFSIERDIGDAVMDFASCERVGLWGIIPSLNT